jgi:hypothetical protein
MRWRRSYAILSLSHMMLAGMSMPLRHSRPRLCVLSFSFSSFFSCRCRSFYALNFSFSWLPGDLCCPHLSCVISITHTMHFFLIPACLNFAITTCKGEFRSTQLGSSSFPNSACSPPPPSLPSPNSFSGAWHYPTSHVHLALCTPLPCCLRAVHTWAYRSHTGIPFCQVVTTSTLEPSAICCHTCHSLCPACCRS